MHRWLILISTAMLCAATGCADNEESETDALDKDPPPARVTAEKADSTETATSESSPEALTDEATVTSTPPAVTTAPTRVTAGDHSNFNHPPTTHKPHTPPPTHKPHTPPKPQPTTHKPH